MGSITCHICQKEFPKTQITKHKLECQRNQERLRQLKECEICKLRMTYGEYIEHRLLHDKDNPKDEDNINPTVSYCEYSFSMNKVLRFTRISENLKNGVKNERADYSKIDTNTYLRNLTILRQDEDNGKCPVQDDIMKMMLIAIIDKANSTNLGSPCSICMNEFKEKDTVLTTPCDHSYHYNCIRQWFRKNNCCPVCKFKMVKENLVLKPSTR